MPRAPAIKEMFAGISPRYDLLNRILSLGVDRGWRRRARAALADPIRPPGPILDLCCGTGDLSLLLAQGGLEVTGVDFCHEMLVIGREKVRSAAAFRIRFAEADALTLPFPDAAFAGAAVAFGVRNLEDLDAGLRELARVLRPGGLLAVLEFATPRGGVARTFYRIYLTAYVPLIGRLVSGDAGAYAYLSSSIRAFPGQERFPRRLERAGLTEIRCEDLTGGIAALYLARKPIRGVRSRSGSARPPSGRAGGSRPDQR